MNKYITKTLLTQIKNKIQEQFLNFIFIIILK